jgi:hypothetical protein
MFDMSLSLLLFVIYLITIMLVLRLIKKISPAVLVCSSALLVYFSGLVLIDVFDYSVNFFTFSSLYWFLTLCLLMIFGAVYKSISLRMMLHLLNQPKKSDYYDAILKNYIKDQSYTNRIGILIEKKMIAPSEKNAFSLTKKGLFFARNLSLIQQFFSIKESG